MRFHQSRKHLILSNVLNLFDKCLEADRKYYQHFEIYDLHKPSWKIVFLPSPQSCTCGKTNSLRVPAYQVTVRPAAAISDTQKPQANGRRHETMVGTYPSLSVAPRDAMIGSGQCDEAQAPTTSYGAMGHDRPVLPIDGPSASTTFGHSLREAGRWQALDRSALDRSPSSRNSRHGRSVEACVLELTLDAWTRQLAPPTGLVAEQPDR
jgi:hypothetical protein